MFLEVLTYTSSVPIITTPGSNARKQGSGHGKEGRRMGDNPL